jgi:hypothetical protein
MIDGPIGIKKKPVEHFSSSLPRLPQVTSCQKTRHAVPCEVMNPAPGESINPDLAKRSGWILPLLELSHDGIYPRETRASLLPRFNHLRIAAPWDLSADGVSRHFVVVGCGVTGKVKVFAPIQLANKRHGGLGMLRVRSEHALQLPEHLP